MISKYTVLSELLVLIQQFPNRKNIVHTKFRRQNSMLVDTERIWTLYLTCVNNEKVLSVANGDGII